MRRETKAQLIKKGWAREDIKKAEDIIFARNLHDKSRSAIHAHRILFWTVMAVMIIGNALIALVLIPIMLVLNKIGADIFVVIIGLKFGLLFNFLVWDIEEHITRKHHLLAITIIPLIAILDLYAIVRITNAINDVFQITAIREDPVTISALYVIAFLLPYLFTLFYKKKIKTY